MPLPHLLEGWSHRAAVRCAAVVDADGLLVHDMLASELDGEAVAALAVTVMRHCHQLGEATGSASVRTVVMDGDAGPTILTPLDEHHTLVVLAKPDLDIGPLLRDIRLSSGSLSQAV